MKLLIDTNIILDIILEREPFVEFSSKLLESAQKHSILLFVTATTITAIYYITRKAKGKTKALALIKDLLQLFNVASVDKNIIINALHSNMPDFEDAVQVFSAIQENINTIITRNRQDFLQSGLSIHTPESFLQSIDEFMI